MALLEKHLVIKRSTIPHAGKGVFTNKNIPKGQRILEYKGRISTWNDVNAHSEYIYYVNKNHVIDGLTDKKSLGRYVNDAKGLTKISGLSNNCKFVKDGVRVFIQSIKNIPKGSELFVGYGKEYWDVEW